MPDEPNQNGLPRVLLADDGRETLALLHGILQYEGVDVVGVAANGFEAVDMADRLRPDVVLMDLRMPGLDGFEATQSIKEAHPWIQVVFLTHDRKVLNQIREAHVLTIGTDSAAADSGRKIDVRR